MKISVIMPSYLGEFPGCAKNRKQKFVRALNSFLSQEHKEKELVVISDGCPDTINILKAHYKNELADGRIILIELPRNPLFTGAVRQAGIDKATGQILCNLDTDDYFMPGHLTSISEGFNTEKYDWVYFNHIDKPDELKDIDYAGKDGKLKVGVQQYFDCQLKDEHICNANVAWKSGLNISWTGCDGKRDNWAFNKHLIENFPNRKKIYGCGYVITHKILKKA